MSPSSPPPTTYAIIRDAARGIAVVTCIALTCALAIKLCTGCTPPAARSPARAAEDAATQAAYAAALQQCLDKGKAAKDFAVYDECAANVDRRFGR